jgi:hypothetical protein
MGLTNLSPSMSRLSIQCGIFNISQAYKPPRSVTGIVFLLSLRYMLWITLLLLLLLLLLLWLYSSYPGCREYGLRDPTRWSRGTLHPQNLALTSPTSGGHSVGIVRSRTEAMELILVSEACCHACNGILIRAVGDITVVVTYVSWCAVVCHGAWFMQRARTEVMWVERTVLDVASISNSFLRLYNPLLGIGSFLSFLIL